MRLAIGTAVVFAGLCSAVAGQVQLRLARVPPDLVLPAREPAPLEVEVAGGPVEQVWLAASGEDPLRLLLRARNATSYAIDLADPRVAALAAAAERRELVVCAGSGGRLLATSEPLRYATVHGPQVGPLRCFAHAGGGAVEVFALPRRRDWFVPAQVERIELQRTAGRGQPSVIARAGDAAWSLVPTAHGWSLPLRDQHRSAWQQAGTLWLTVEDEGAMLAQFRLRAAPARLALDEGTHEVTVLQRRSAELPGSGGYIELLAGDVTHGQVLAELRGAKGEQFVAPRSMRPGDVVPFTLGGEQYALVLQQLRNLLIGDDQAVFRVALHARLQRSRIDALLARVEREQVVFEREGEEHDGPTAAAHLRRKLAASGSAAGLTLESFIERIGSRSSTTGRPYHVRRADGTRVEAGVWLRELAAEVEAAERTPAVDAAKRDR
jgi:hypothetical protein